MKLIIKTDVYNERRYGRPWIADVDFSNNKKGDFKFGDWIGQSGYEGLLELDTQVGSIVAKGQKDNRKPSNSAPNFYIVQGDGSLEKVSKVDAYTHAAENQSDESKLLEEKARLLTRLDEIEELLKD